GFASLGSRAAHDQSHPSALRGRRDPRQGGGRGQAAVGEAPLQSGHAHTRLSRRPHLGGRSLDVVRRPAPDSRLRLPLVDAAGECGVPGGRPFAAEDRRGRPRSIARGEVRRRIAFWLVLLAAWGAAGVASANPSEDLARGRSQFERGQYRKVVDLLSPQLYPRILLHDDEEIKEAHYLLGVSQFFLEHRDLARQEFTALLFLDPK